jgi:hypothetical protein
VEYYGYDADRQLAEKALGEKAAATLSDLAAPTQHPSWEDCVAKDQAAQAGHMKMNGEIDWRLIVSYMSHKPDVH